MALFQTATDYGRYTMVHVKDEVQYDRLMLNICSQCTAISANASIATKYASCNP